MSVPRDFGHVHRQRSRPVHIGHDVTRIENGSRLTSDRLLQCQQRHALRSAATLISAICLWSVITGSARARPAPQQGLGCVVDHCRDQPAHLADLLAQRSQLVVIGGSHDMSSFLTTNARRPPAALPRIRGRPLVPCCHCRFRHL
jgi:hypothetical protein